MNSPASQGIWTWADECPFDAAELTASNAQRHRISLGEGTTPLVRSRRIGPSAGASNLWFKLETVNPSGSYKDRFAAAAVSGMLARGQDTCVATSSGNTGAALAAYCAAAGIRCEIAAVETAPAEKLKQMMVYGARVYTVRGFGVDAETTVRAIDAVGRRAARPGAALQISAFVHSPVGMSGVQTIAYELISQTQGRIEHVFVPAGGGGLTLAIARGFATSTDARPVNSSRRPRVHCVQPSGNDTIASPLRSGAAKARAVACATRISGLQVATVLDGHEVITACRATGGTGHIVEDDEVWALQKRLAVDEGIFCEPAGAVALAGALRAVSAGEVSGDALICCLITGVGFKDAPSVDRMLSDSICPMVDVADIDRM